VHPLRILILAGLFYLLYRLVRGKRRVRRAEGNGPGEAPPLADDVLVEDPVCHTYIPRRQALKVTDRGAEYYFCSEECRKHYLANKGEKTT